MKRKKKRNTTPVFKEYNQEQGWLFPPNLNDMVPTNHLVRTIDHIIEQIDMTPLMKTYKGGGTSSYHPKMLLKLLIYAYTQRIYTSRQIAKAARENIFFMWLTGSNQPDFRTINRFRSSRLKSVIDEIFYSVIEILKEAGLIHLEHYFLDGTKIEANANRYTWVWRKSTTRYKSNLEEKVKSLLVEIDDCNTTENDKYGDKDLEEMGEDVTPLSSEEIEKKVKELDERLEKDENNKELKKAVKVIKNDYLPRMRKYEEQEVIFGDRNSYSKTDHDATFMRMKDDQMRNGQLKPAYNIQMGTENQFIVGYSIHQKTTDTSCLKPHLEGLKQNLHAYPARIIADAGYGSEENYKYLDKQDIENYVKFNYFHMEQKKKFKSNPFRKENFPYDKKTDSYQCPAGKKLSFTEVKKNRTRSGYLRTEYIYSGANCNKCTYQKECYHSKNGRKIILSPLLEYYKTESRQKLNSATGRVMRSKRPIEVESVFGQIKWNRNFTRFLLKGLEKVKIEWGLISLAHNMMKIPI